MMNPSDAFNKAINGVEDFMTPRRVKQQRTFVRPPVAAPSPTPKFTRPTIQKQITIGQNNAQNASTMPKGTVFGATPQQKALNFKVK